MTVGVKITAPPPGWSPGISIDSHRSTSPYELIGENEVTVGDLARALVVTYRTSVLGTWRMAFRGGVLKDDVIASAGGVAYPFELRSDGEILMFNSPDGAIAFEGVTSRGAFKLRERYFGFYVQRVVQPLEHFPGSLAEHIKNFTDSVFSTPRSGNNHRAWSSNNYSALSLIASRNQTNPVVSSVDLTSFTAAVEGRGASFPVTLATPRHVVGAAHVYPGNNKTLAWVGASGAVHTAKTVRYHKFDNMADTFVAYLDRAVPPDVTPAAVFPPEVFSKGPTVMGTYKSIKTLVGYVAPYYPTVRFFVRRCMGSGGDRYGWVAPAATYPLTPPDYNIPYFGNIGNFSAHALGAIDLAASRSAGAFIRYTAGDWALSPGGWAESLPVGGESGSQVFTSVNGRTVILFHYHTAAGDGGRMSGSAGIINPILNSLKDASDTTTYALDEVDLSMFPDFT